MDEDEGELGRPFLNSTVRPVISFSESDSRISLGPNLDVTRRYLVNVLPSDGKGNGKDSGVEGSGKTPNQQEERQDTDFTPPSEDLTFSSSAPGLRQLPLSFLYPGNALRQSKHTFRPKDSALLAEVQSVPSSGSPILTGSLPGSGAGGRSTTQGLWRPYPMLSTSTLRAEVGEAPFLSGIPPPPVLPPQGSLSTPIPATLATVAFPFWNASVGGGATSLCSGAGGGTSVAATGGARLASALPSMGVGEIPSGVLSIQSVSGTGVSRSQGPMEGMGASGISIPEPRPPSASPKVVEVLNLSPYTAAYRNFTESSLSEIYTILSTMANEIEQFAYSQMVDQFYNNYGEEGVTSSSSVVPNVWGMSPEHTLPVGIQRVSLPGILGEDFTLNTTARTDIADNNAVGYFVMGPPLAEQVVRAGRKSSERSLGSSFTEKMKRFPSPGGDFGEHSTDGFASFNTDVFRRERESTVYSFFGPEPRRHSKEFCSRLTGEGVRSGFERPTTSSPRPSTNPALFHTRYPLCSESNYFLYTEDWFADFPLPYTKEDAKVALTTEAPLFFCGMLLDPVSEKYLFGGAMFYEECRVLRVPVDPPSEQANPKKDKMGFFKPVGDTLSSENISSQKAYARVLLREYISLKREEQGFIVQTFSILDQNSKIEGRRNLLISSATARSLLNRSRAGALTRAFALQQVVTLKAVKRVSQVVEHQKSFLDGSSLSTLDKVDSLLPSLFFARNIIPRYFSGPTLHLQARRKENNVLPVSKCRFRKDISGNADEETYFLSQDISLRPTVDLEMQQNASLFIKAIDHIKAYLIFFKDSFSLHTMIKVFFHSVRRLQRFFRYCLAKKQRAAARMVRLWRHLEGECKLKLHHYHPPPSSTERIDMIAANLLLPQMITTREYKEGIIQDLWGKQRENYRKWKQEYCEDELLKKSGATAVSMKGFHTIPNLPSAHERTMVPFSDVETALEKALRTLRQSNWKGKGEKEGKADAEAAPGNSEEEEGGENDGFLHRDETNIFQRPSKRGSTTLPVRHVTVDDIKKNRMKDEMHRLFGWYIEPEKLLYESHHRLLTSLKESVLAVEEVRLEIQRLSLERAERRGGTSSGVGSPVH